MKISFRWLAQYLTPCPEVTGVAEALTAIGLEVEHEEQTPSADERFQGLVVGEVLSCVQHPNADKLHCTEVSVGGEPLKIVCGAPNVATGQKVVVATIGTKLQDKEGNSFTIKKSKLRGEVSEGMLCAEDEIGLGDSHDGIMVLPADTKVGTPLAELFPSEGNTVFEIGLTANRADAMSHYGVARDLAAYLNLTSPCKATLPALKPLAGTDATGAIALGDVDAARCIRYCGLTLRGVKVTSSPAWMQEALQAIGVRPINNVVDITNYVLHETSNPLHAFDLKAFTTGRVSVRTLPEGTPFTTLDGKERKLRSDDLCICDGATPLCLAGVFGGLDSGVKDTTTDIFLEAAVFDPVTVRKTAHFHGLNTDASFRFERGIDPQFTPYSLQRAAQLLVEYAGATVEGAALDYYPTPCTPHELEVDLQRLRGRLGYDMPDARIAKILDGLEIAHKDLGNGVWHLSVPYYRIDVTREADIVEELLRLGGFPPLGENRISFALDSRNSYRAPRIEAVKDLLVGAGFQEIMSLSLTNGEVAKGLFASEAVKLLNPLSADLDTLRQDLVFGACDAVARNITRQRPDLRFFETGHVFERTTGSGKSEATTPLRNYVERSMLSLTLTGDLTPATWLGAASPVSVFHLKGYFDAVCAAYKVDPSALEYTEHSADDGLYLYSLEVRLAAAGKGAAQPVLLGRLGQLSPQLLKRFGVKVAVFYATLYTDVLEAHYAAADRLQVQPLPRFPEVRRDLSLLVAQDVTFAALQGVAFRAEKQLLRDMSLFDVYEGEGVPAGKRSYAIAFTLQDVAKTLTDADIDAAMQRLLSRFQKDFGAELRG